MTDLRKTPSTRRLLAAVLAGLLLALGSACGNQEAAEQAVGKSDSPLGISIP